MAPTPKIIENSTPLLASYDVVLCDVWGVVHDGRHAHAPASVVLSDFRRRGGTVILVSNAPTPSDNVARVLDEKGVARDAWDAIVSSGDLALGHIKRSGWTALHHIGPARRDRSFFEALKAPSVPIDSADAIACTGLVDDRTETPEDYRARLTAARQRDLPLVCANPDRVVHVGDDLLVCAGAIGALYAEMGGEVYWAGKPYPVAYQTALVRAARLRGAPVTPDRVLAIGDAVHTDLAAAAGAGVDALFIASGIHRHEAMEDGAVSPAMLERLFAAPGASPALAAASALRP